MFFSTPIQTANSLSALLACAYAIWRGGRTERGVAALILVDWFVSPILQSQESFKDVQYGVFVLDGMITLTLLGVALRSDRYWPLWVTGLQILELLMHAAMGIDHHIRPRAYFVGIEISSYFILLSLVAGVWLEAPRGRLARRPRLSRP
jgi:hypothetical protein